MNRHASESDPCDDAAAPGGGRVDLVCALVVLVLSVALWVPRLRGPIDLRWDAGVYYILGTSLYEGKGYRLLNEPGEIQAVQYPPLLPAVVAAHQVVLGTSDFLSVGPWLRMTFFAMSVALALSGYRLARLYLAPVPSLLAAAVAASCFNTYCFSDALYAEIPLALVATWLAIFHHRAARTGSLTFAALTGATAVVGFLLRTAGLALLAAWVGESLIRRRFKQAAARGAVALVPVVLWQGYIAVVAAGPAYQRLAYPYQRADYYYSNVPYAQNSRLLDPFRPEFGPANAGQLLTRTLSNAKAFPVAMGEAISVPTQCWDWSISVINRRLGGAPLPAWLMMISIRLLLCALIVVGAVMMSVRGQWFVPLCFVASSALIILTPWTQQFTRYLVPMVPFMAVFLVSGGTFVAERSRRAGDPWDGVVRAVGVMLVAGLFAVDGFWVVRSFSRDHMDVVYRDARGVEHEYRLLHYGPEWVALDDSLEWVRRHAAPGDVVATTLPHTAYVRFGVKSVLPPMVTDPAEARRLLDAVPVRFVVLDSLNAPDISPRYAEPAVRTDPARWRLAYTAPGPETSFVYERVQP